MPDKPEKERGGDGEPNGDQPLALHAAIGSELYWSRYAEANRAKPGDVWIGAKDQSRYVVVEKYGRSGHGIKLRREDHGKILKTNTHELAKRYSPNVELTRGADRNDTRGNQP